MGTQPMNLGPKSQTKSNKMKFAKGSTVVDYRPHYYGK